MVPLFSLVKSFYQIAIISLVPANKKSRAFIIFVLGVPYNLISKMGLVPMYKILYLVFWVAYLIIKSESDDFLLIAILTLVP